MPQDKCCNSNSRDIWALKCCIIWPLVFLIKTHIGSLWSRESHHSWLSTGSLRARWAGATVLTSGTLSKAQGKNLKQHRNSEIADINFGSLNFSVLITALCLHTLRLTLKKGLLKSKYLSQSLLIESNTAMYSIYIKYKALVLEHVVN